MMKKYNDNNIMISYSRQDKKESYCSSRLNWTSVISSLGRRKVIIVIVIVTVVIVIVIVMVVVMVLIQYNTINSYNLFVVVVVWIPNVVYTVTHKPTYMS